MPTTANELLLLAALQALQSQDICTEAHTFKLQASNVKWLYTKLVAQEEKCNKKSIKLVGDGLAWLLIVDEFYDLAQQKEKEMHEVVREEERK